MYKIPTIFIIFLQIIVKIQYIIGYTNPNYTLPATTVQRIETFANGCYTQLVREPDFSNIQRFHETEQLICPPGVNITNLTHRNLTTYPVSTNLTYATIYHPNNTPYAPSAPVYNHPPYMPPSAHVPMPVVPASPTGYFVPPPAIPTNTNPAMNPSTVHHSVLQPTGGMTSNNNNNKNISHIILLANRTGIYDHGKRKNVGNSLRNIKWIFVFVFVSTFCNYN